MYPLLLLASFLGTDGTMFYILFRNRSDRKSSVSLHAAIDNHSHAIFALGHFIGGLAFLCFSYKFFYVDNGLKLLFALACFGFLAEQVQAFLPNKSRFVAVHTTAAVSMATFISIIVFLAPFSIHLSASWLVGYVGLIALLCLFGIRAILIKHTFYQTQMLFFCAFYIFLSILIYGRSA